MTVTATFALPAGSADWIGMGFAKTNANLTGDTSGPWIKVEGTGTVTFYGGPATNPTITLPGAFTNTGTATGWLLSYDAFRGVATVAATSANATNILLDSTPVKAGAAARGLVFEFSASAVILSNRWVSDVAVDWFPRPPPLLALPVAPGGIVVKEVGAPSGGSDLSKIQLALDFAATNGSPTEVRFDAGATYIISNSSPVAAVPLALTPRPERGGEREWLPDFDQESADWIPASAIVHERDRGRIHGGLRSPALHARRGDPESLHRPGESRGTPESAIEFRLDAGYPGADERQLSGQRRGGERGALGHDHGHEPSRARRAESPHDLRLQECLRDERKRRFQSANVRPGDGGDGAIE